MRLLLTSDRQVPDPDRLLRLVGKRRTGLVSVNALDQLPADERAERVRETVATLRGWGLKAAELDLRTQTPMAVAEQLMDAGFWWVAGGNTFLLRRAMGACALDQLLPQLLKRDAFAYLGHSAGACVLAPDLAGLEAGDDPQIAEEAYGASSSTSGLGVLDRPLVPHVNDPQWAAISEAYAAAGQSHWALRDGEALVIDGRKIEAPAAAAR